MAYFFLALPSSSVGENRHETERMAILMVMAVGSFVWGILLLKEIIQCHCSVFCNWLRAFSFANSI